MVSTRFKSLFCVVAVLLMMVTCAQDPGTSPYDCSKTKAYFVLKSSLNQLSDVEISDTVGNTISYGFNSNLFMNVDSVQIVQITSSNPTGNILTTFKDIKARKYTDTVWGTLQLSDTGSITIQGIAYFCGNKVSGTVTIHSLSRAPNHPPKLLVPRQIQKYPGDLCSFVVTASDSDNSQILTISSLYGPSGSSFDPQSHVFTWAVPSNFIGTDSAIFKVQDNGYPPLSDQETVYINVQATFVNHPPVLTVKGVRNLNPGDTCTLRLSAADPDPLQTITISMLQHPNGSILKDSIFTWVTPGSLNGKDSVTFIANDNGLPPKSDTVKVFISVLNNIPLPSRPDSLKILSRINGLVSLQWRASAAADYYTVFRTTTTHAGAFTAVDTVYDTLCKDLVGSLNCQYFVKAYNKTGESPSSDTVVSLFINPKPKWQHDTINEVAM